MVSSQILCEILVFNSLEKFLSLILKCVFDQITTAPVDFSASKEMDLRVFPGVLEVAKINLIIAIILEVVSSAWHSSEIQTYHTAAATAWQPQQLELQRKRSGLAFGL